MPAATKLHTINLLLTFPRITTSCSITITSSHWRTCHCGAGQPPTVIFIVVSRILVNHSFFNRVVTDHLSYILIITTCAVIPSTAATSIIFTINFMMLIVISPEIPNHLLHLGTRYVPNTLLDHFVPYRRFCLRCRHLHCSLGLYQGSVLAITFMLVRHQLSLNKIFMQQVVEASLPSTQPHAAGGGTR